MDTLPSGSYEVLLEIVPVPALFGKYVPVVSPSASLVEYEVLGHREDVDIVEQPADRLAAGVAETVEPIEFEMVTCSKFAAVAPERLPAGGTEATDEPFGS